MSELPTTRWSLIRASADDDSQARVAWETLVAGYERAIVAFFRRSSLRDEADDLAQAFMTESIAGGWWARADQERGSFRNFLYLLLRRFLAKRYRELAGLPERGDCGTEPPDPGRGAGHAYDMAFVMSLTRNAMKALRDDYEGRGRRELFDVLMPLLSDPAGHGQLQKLARQLDMRPNSLTVELRRLRQRLGRKLQEEVGQLCTNDDQFEAEMAAIRSLLSDSELSHLSSPG